MLVPSLLRKAQPTASDLHIDRLLTNISIAYMNTAYIADQIFPMVPVQKQSDRIPLFNQSFWYRDDPRVRAPGQKSVRGGFDVDNSAIYFADRFSRGFEIPDEVRRNADLPYNRGLVLVRAGKPGDARAAFERARHIDPTQAEAHWALSVLAVESGNLAAARERWRDVVRYASAESPYRGRAVSYLKAAGNPR